MTPLHLRTANFFLDAIDWNLFVTEYFCDFFLRMFEIAKI